MVDLKFTLGSTMYFEVVKVKYRELGRTLLKAIVQFIIKNKYHLHIEKVMNVYS